MNQTRAFSNFQIFVRLSLIAVLTFGVSTVTTSCSSCTPEEELRKNQVNKRPRSEIEKKVQEQGEKALTPGEKQKFKEHSYADKYLTGPHISDPHDFYFPEVQKGNSAGKITKPELEEKKFKAFKDGLMYKDLSDGFGMIPEPGGRVLIHYTGWLSDGTKFVSTLDKRMPVKFKYGKGEIIRGLDEGVTGMKVGGVRKLIVPANLAYGSTGNQELNQRKAYLCSKAS